MRNPRSFLVLLLLGLVPAAFAGDISKEALVTIDVASHMNASPDRVWSVITDPATAVSWCPLWKDSDGDKQSLDTVGHTIHYADEYGNTGMSVVVFADEGKELRIAHVPDNGSYLCQTTIKLAAMGDGTHVTVQEQYSDQLDVPLDKDTATHTRDAVKAYVAALQEIAEAR